MGLFFKKDKTPKRQWPSVIKNASISGDMICLHGEQDFSTRSTLIVQPGEEAIFVKNGVIEQVFTNGTYELTTENYPFLQRLIRLFTDGDSTFNCRVYYVRVASSVEIVWGTDTPIQVRDNVLKVQTKIKANGAYKVQVGDSARFLTKLVGNGMTKFSPTNIKDYFRSEMMSDIKSTIASVVNNSGEEVIGIAERQKEIGELVGQSIKESFAEYGIELLKFSISTIYVDDDNLRRRYDEANMKAFEAIKEAEAKKAAMDTYGSRWREQKQFDIMEKMVDNPVDSAMSSAANLGMGLATGAAVVGMGQQVMSQQVMPQQTQCQAAPPPPPVSSWYIYRNGQQFGPMSLAQVQQCVSTGQLALADSVWREGFASWVPASNVPEIAQFFAQVPPAPPVPPTPPVPPVK